MPQARRLRLVVLVHMPLGDRPRMTRRSRGSARSCRPPPPSSRPAPGAGAGCSSSTGCPPTGCMSPSPASDAADLATGTATGEALLCVAAVTADKGHDVLLDALATITELSWHCDVRGPPGPRPGVRRRAPRRSRQRGLGDRVSFPGPRTGADLDRSYAAADLLVLASRAETYGMVVTEALARGLPVVATDVGGVTEALGHGADGTRPGLLVAPDDPAALGGALRCLARRRRAERRGCAGPPASGASRSPDGRPPRRSSPASWPRRRDDAEAIRVSRDGSPCASPPTPRPVRATSSSTSAGSRRRRSRVIHDLGCGTGAMGRWLAPLLPGPQHWVLHDRDADLLEVAAADVPGRPPTAPRSPSRRGASDITRLRAGRSRRRDPDHRLGAAGHADRRRAGPAGQRSAPAPGARSC